MYVQHIINTLIFLFEQHIDDISKAYLHNKKFEYVIII